MESPSELIAPNIAVFIVTNAAVVVAAKAAASVAANLFGPAAVHRVEGRRKSFAGLGNAASGAECFVNPLYYVRAIFDPLVALGVVMLIVALLTRMVLLSLADLSFVLPVTAVGYILAALLGKVVLHEVVTTQRWMGTILIFAGAALVSSTTQKTTVESTLKTTGESPK